MENAKSKNSLSRRFSNSSIKQELIVIVIILLVSTGLSMARPNSFPTMLNIFNILKQASQYAVLSIGMGLVIITGGIDISVGGMISLSICLATYVNRTWNGISPFFMLLIIFFTGLLVGFINGILVAKAGVPLFVATMGMLNVCNGFSLLLTNGTPIKYEDTWISVFGGGYIGIIPVQVIVMLVMIFLAYIFSKYTVIGRNIYATGNNAKAAKLTGIKIDNITILVYVISGLMSALVGLMMLGQLKQAGPSYGNGYELESIAAVVIGGISMTGGEGNMPGVALGAILIALLKNLFVQLAVPGYWQTVVLGLVIIMSVAIDTVRTKKQAA